MKTGKQGVPMSLIERRDRGFSSKVPMQHRCLLLAAAALSLLGSAEAFADTAVCTGKLTTVGNHANGVNGLYVVVGNSTVIRVCSLTSAQFSVTPDDCKHMASLAALAFATEASVTFYIDNAPSTSCSAVPGWFIANTRYFSVNK